jgi:hypothetical protein
VPQLKVALRRREGSILAHHSPVTGEGSGSSWTKSRVVEVEEAPVQGSFSRVIEEHSELKRRNSCLEEAMPISVYLEIVAADAAEVALGSRSAAADSDDDDPPTETLVRGAQTCADPDSWWNVSEPGVGWAT